MATTYRLTTITYKHIDIITASYVANNTWSDVGAKLRLLMGTLNGKAQLHLPRKDAFAVYFGDPLAGVAKKLLVEYTIDNGPRQSIEIPDALGSPRFEDIPAVSAKIEVISARYGCNLFANVLPQVQQNMTNNYDGRFVLVGIGSLTQLFGDPDPGNRKRLIIKYKLNGTEREESYDENDHGDIYLPPPDGSTMVERMPPTDTSIDKMRAARIRVEMLELDEIRQVHHPDLLIDSSDVGVWTAYLLAGPQTPYKGRVLRFDLTIPRLYPVTPPNLRFVSKVYHPNVCADGTVRLGILEKGKWKQGYSLFDVITEVKRALNSPAEDCGGNQAALDLWKRDKAAYFATAAATIK